MKRVNLSLLLILYSILFMSCSFFAKNVSGQMNDSLFDNALQKCLSFWANCDAKNIYCQKAIEACKQAIRLKPNDAFVHYMLGNSYQDLGMHKKAIEAYKKAISIDPDDAGAHCGLSNSYRSLGKYQEAVEAYKQAIRIKHDYVEAHNNLGYFYPTPRKGKIRGLYLS